ncbi:MAG: V-type ATP synthase subunit A, partial [Chromatiales bacterium]
MSDAGSVVEVNGPLVKVRLPHVRTGEQVSIGSLALTGEVLGRKGDEAIVQVYESTETVRPGDDVVPLGHPLSVELGPGLLGRIFDGVQRPLDEISRLHGDTIPRGISVTSLDREAVWHFTPRPGLTVGEQLSEGFSLGEVPETESIVHHILVPPGINGKLVELAPAGEYRVEDTIAVLHGAEGREHRLQLFHRWPVRVPRPHVRRIHTAEPLLSGQRIIDLFFPVLKGGKAAIPGPFGAGKTILQHQIARWSNADIVIYVGCGERGNELVDILNSFPALKDPYSGRSLMERTLLVANTSNMPVVAREAS